MELQEKLNNPTDPTNPNNPGGGFPKPKSKEDSMEYARRVAEWYEKTTGIKIDLDTMSRHCQRVKHLKMHKALMDLGHLEVKHLHVAKVNR